MYMKLWGLLLLGSISLAACQKEPPPAPVAPETAARIGTVTITEADIQAATDLLDAKDQQFAQNPIGKQNLIQILTREKLIEQDARATGLDKSEEFEQLLAGKKEELDRIYEQFATEALERLWYEQKSKEFTPSEKEIKAYFDQYPYEMTIKQIILDNAQTADQMLRALKSSPGRWNEVSRQYNIAPQSLRTLTFMPGEYLDNLEVVAANSSVGKVQGFFKTAQGFHIIMKTNEKRLSFQEAKPRIEQILKHRKLDQLLDALKLDYEVVIYDKNE